MPVFEALGALKHDPSQYIREDVPRGSAMPSAGSGYTDACARLRFHRHPRMGCVWRFDKKCPPAIHKFCEEFLAPSSKLNCTSLELYSARCSVVHNLGWESDLSATGKARAVFYSFGTDDPTSAQKAYDQEYPGKYVGVRADNLLEVVESCANELASMAETDPALRVRLKEAAGKQYMSMESRTSDELFKNVIKGGS